MRPLPEKVCEKSVLDQAQDSVSRVGQTLLVQHLSPVVCLCQQSPRSSAFLSFRPQIHLRNVFASVSAKRQVRVPSGEQTQRNQAVCLRPRLRTRFRDQSQAGRAHAHGAPRREAVRLRGLPQEVRWQPRPAETLEKVPRRRNRPTHSTQPTPHSASHCCVLSKAVTSIMKFQCNGLQKYRQIQF